MLFSCPFVLLRHWAELWAVESVQVHRTVRVITDLKDFRGKRVLRTLAAALALNRFMISLVFRLCLFGLFIGAASGAACQSPSSSSPALSDYHPCPEGEDGCDDETFEDCSVRCNGNAACRGTSFFQSAVDCSTSQCGGSQLYASYVNCTTTYDATCRGVELFRCSCCDCGSCPDGVPLCFSTGQGEDDPATATLDFCSSLYLGRTCKEWGNPACANADLEDVPPLHPAAGCSLGKDVAVRGKGGNFEGGCVRRMVQNCTTLCDGGDACDHSTFQGSTIACIDTGYGGACDNANFYGSDVDCSSSQCSRSDFIGSAVNCDGDAMCRGVEFRCSCCNGKSCPDGVPSCTGDEILKFCSETFLERTCKDWGNPACKDVFVETLPPLRAAETCSLGDEINICATESCKDLEVDRCAVLCDDGACGGTLPSTFSRSHVECLDSGCTSAVFSESSVKCSSSSCFNARFFESAVDCSGSGFTNCDLATFSPAAAVTARVVLRPSQIVRINSKRSASASVGKIPSARMWWSRRAVPLPTRLRRQVHLPPTAVPVPFLRGKLRLCGVFQPPQRRS